MHKKEYVSPELMLMRFTLKDTICSSPEDYNSHIDGPGDFPQDPILPDPEDDIEW